MNRFTRLIACSVLVSTPLFVFAQGNSGQMSRGGMMNQEQMQQMHQNMSKMQEMMQEMRNAKSDAERQRIREKHMESMQQHMHWETQVPPCQTQFSHFFSSILMDG